MRKKRSVLCKENRYIVGVAKLLYAIDYLGRYCVECRFDGHQEPWFMDFHHLDPSRKEYNVKNKVMHRNFCHIEDELKKCQLLCGRCHRKLHSQWEKYVENYRDIVKKLVELKHKSGVLRSQKRFTKKETELIASLISDGKNLSEIAEITDREYDSVKKKVRSLGLKAARKRLKINKEQIYQMIADGKSIREIERETGVSRMTISKRLQEWQGEVV